MLILNAKDVDYSHTDNSKSLPSLTYRGHLFYKVTHTAIDQLENIIRLSRKFLDLDEPVATIIVKEDRGLSLWSLDNSVGIKPNQNFPQSTELQENAANRNKLDEDFISYCSTKMAEFIGPIASLVVKKTLDGNREMNKREFIEALAREIPNPQLANEFQMLLLKQDKI